MNSGISPVTVKLTISLKNLHPPEGQKDQFEKNRIFLNKLLNSHVKQEQDLG